MKYIFLFLLVSAVLQPGIAQADGGHVGFKIAECPNEKGHDCFMEFKQGKLGKQYLTAENFGEIKNLVIKHPDLDWLAVLDASGTTGSTLKTQIQQQGVEFETAKMNRLKYFADKQGLLSPIEQKEKKLLYAESIHALSLKFPPDKLFLSFKNGEEKDLAKKFLSALEKANSSPASATAPAAAASAATPAAASVAAAPAAAASTPAAATAADAVPTCKWKWRPLSVTKEGKTTCSGITVNCNVGNSAEKERQLTCVLDNSGCKVDECIKNASNSSGSPSDGGVVPGAPRENRKNQDGKR